MFTVAFGEYTVLTLAEGLPAIYPDYVKHADLAEEIELQNGSKHCFLGISRNGSWPSLVVAQGYEPRGCLCPGCLVVPETSALFVGAGERLLAYDLAKPERLWVDSAEFGFWGWQRHEDIVVMSAEIEMAAWDIHGRKLWSAFVEPPWHYECNAGVVILNVMDKITSFVLKDGPENYGTYGLKE